MKKSNFLRAALLTLFLLATNAKAIGIQNVSGTVDSFDKSNIVLKQEHGPSLKVPRSLLSDENEKNLKPGQKLQLNIDLRTIEKLNPKSKNK
ncbi:MAG: hypothetical protein H7301_12975 [Cryobacterium sp.]|nr:hypothetical protein [Oligoflexia bacterium]